LELVAGYGAVFGFATELTTEKVSDPFDGDPFDGVRHILHVLKREQGI